MFRYHYVLIGPLPRLDAGQVSGVQLGFKLFVDALTDSRKNVIKVINTSPVSKIKKEHISGSFSLKRAWSVVGLLFSAILPIFFSRTVYLLVGSSLGGFLRDSLLIWAAWVTNSRIVLHLNGGGYQAFYDNMSTFMQWVIRTTFNRADCIIVLGESLREQFYFVSNPARIKVVPNGMPEIVDKRSFQPKRLPSLDKPIEILYLSNLISSKGYWDVLLACQILREEGIRYKCHFAGRFAQINVESDRELFSSVQEAKDAFFSMIEQDGLGESVVYHGVVLGAEKENLLRQANLFVLPTYYEWEGQPLSIIEALSTGTPVITTRHKAIPDVIQEGKNGLFVAPKNPTAIAQAVKILLNEPEKYRRLSEQAFISYQEAFTVEAHIKRMMEIVATCSQR